MDEWFGLFCAVVGAPLCMALFHGITQAFQKDLIKDTGWKWWRHVFTVMDASYAGLCGIMIAHALARLGVFLR